MPRLCARAKAGARRTLGVCRCCILQQRTHSATTAVLGSDAAVGVAKLHPLLTGRCPHCEVPIPATDLPPVHWDCVVCGWKDESI
jgi:hypothetical protein